MWGARSRPEVDPGRSNSVRPTSRESKTDRDSPEVHFAAVAVSGSGLSVAGASRGIPHARTARRAPAPLPPHRPAPFPSWHRLPRAPRPQCPNAIPRASPASRATHPAAPTLTHPRSSRPSRPRAALQLCPPSPRGRHRGTNRPRPNASRVRVPPCRRGSPRHPLRFCSLSPHARADRRFCRDLTSLTARWLSTAPSPLSTIHRSRGDNESAFGGSSVVCVLGFEHPYTSPRPAVRPCAGWSACRGVAGRRPQLTFPAAPTNQIPEPPVPRLRPIRAGLGSAAGIHAARRATWRYSSVPSRCAGASRVSPAAGSARRLVGVPAGPA